jgi:translation initiation factor 1A
MYAQATKMLGNGRLMCACEDGVERMGKIRGSMRRSEWISVGDVVLTGIREYQDAKCDVLMRYTLDEVRILKRLGELSNVISASAAAAAADNDDDNDTNETLVDFEYDDGDDSFIGTI